MRDYYSDRIQTQENLPKWTERSEGPGSLQIGHPMHSGHLAGHWYTERKAESSGSPCFFNANPAPISFCPGGPGIMAHYGTSVLFFRQPPSAIKLNMMGPVNNVLLKSTIDLLFVRSARSIKQTCTSNRHVAGFKASSSHPRRVCEALKIFRMAGSLCAGCSERQ